MSTTSSNTTQTPQSVQRLIDRYQNLHINGHQVCTPYFRNVKHERAGLLALLGKGRPAEIEQEVLVYAKLRDVDMNSQTPQDIREFMLRQGIGIDCSGYVSHLLNDWLRSTRGKSLYSAITFPTTTWMRAVIRWFRPVANTSADILTNSENTIPVPLQEVHPGDLIRLKGIDSGHHVALVVEVARNDAGKIQSLTYTHSTNNYGDGNGVRMGTINITKTDGDLGDQQWLEVDENGHCWTLDQYQKDKEDNGLRRPKFFTKSND